MEHLTGVIRLLAEGGWRIGLPLALIGGAVIAAYRLNFPEPGVLSSYLGWASLFLAAGIAFTVVSGITAVISAIVSAIRRRSNDARYRADRRDELMANFSSLDGNELSVLRELLRSRRRRFMVSYLSNAHALIEKGILQPVSRAGAETMCEMPDDLVKDRDQIIAAIDQVVPSRSGT